MDAHYLFCKTHYVIKRLVSTWVIQWQVDSSKYNYRCPHRRIEDGFEIQSLLGLSHLVLLSILTNPITVGSFEPVKSHLASTFVLTFAELTRRPKLLGMFFVDSVLQVHNATKRHWPISFVVICWESSQTPFKSCSILHVAELGETLQRL